MIFNSENNFDIFPNPLSGTNIELKANLASKSEVKVQITDLAGKIVMQKILGQFEAGLVDQSIDLGSLPKGIYILTIKTIDGQKSKKMIRL